MSSTNSGPAGRASATRSPGSIPSEPSLRASPVTAAASRPYVSGAPSSGARSAGESAGPSRSVERTSWFGLSAMSATCISWPISGPSPQPRTLAMPGPQSDPEECVLSASATNVSLYRLLIDGEDVDPDSGRTLESLNPTTGAVWAEIAAADAAAVDRAVTAASRAFSDESWRSLSPTRVGRLMMRFAEEISEHAEHIARIETQDNGKLYKEML